MYRTLSYVTPPKCYPVNVNVYRHNATIVWFSVKKAKEVYWWAFSMVLLWTLCVRGFIYCKDQR